MQNIIKDDNLITRIFNYTNWADDDYVTYEVAVKLSKIHFPQYHQLYNGEEIIDVDEHPEIKAYASDEPHNLIDLNSLILYGVTEKPNITVYTAPTLNVVNKWLKTIYSYSVLIEYTKEIPFKYDITIINHKQNIKYTLPRSEYASKYSVDLFDYASMLSTGIDILISNFILPDLKLKYWQPGNIVITRGNGPAIIINEYIAAAKLGAIDTIRLDNNLLSTDTMHDKRVNTNDIMAIYKVEGINAFDIFDEKQVRSHATLLWEREETMTWTHAKEINKTI